MSQSRAAPRNDECMYDDNVMAEELERHVYVHHTHQTTIRALATSVSSALDHRQSGALMDIEWMCDKRHTIPAVYGGEENTAIANFGAVRDRMPAPTVAGPEFLASFIRVRARISRWITGVEPICDAAALTTADSPLCERGLTCALMWNEFACERVHSAGDIMFAELMREFYNVVPNNSDLARASALGERELAITRTHAMFPAHRVVVASDAVLDSMPTGATEIRVALSRVRAAYRFIHDEVPHILMGDGYIERMRVGMCERAHGCRSGGGLVCLAMLTGRRCDRRHTTRGTLGTLLVSMMMLRVVAEPIAMARVVVAAPKSVLEFAPRAPRPVKSRAAPVVAKPAAARAAAASNPFAALLAGDDSD